MLSVIIHGEDALQILTEVRSLMWWSGSQTDLGYSTYYNHTVYTPMYNISMRDYLGAHFWDPLGQRFCSFAMPSPSSLNPFVNWGLSSGSSDLELYGGKPFVSGREVPDVVRKGDLFRHIGQFFTGQWHFQNSDGKIPRENPVTHTGLYGRIIGNDVNFNYSFDGSEERLILPSSFRRIAGNRLEFTDWTSSGGNPTIGSLSQQWVANDLTGMTYVVGPSGTWSYSDVMFDFNEEANTCTFSYHCHRHIIRAFNEWCDVEYNATFTWEPIYVSPSAPSLNAWRHIGDYIYSPFRARWDFDSWVITTTYKPPATPEEHCAYWNIPVPAIVTARQDIYEPGSLMGSQVYANRHFAQLPADVQTYLGDPFWQDSEGLTHPNFRTDSTPETSFGHFMAACEHVRNDCHALSNFAANDAMQKHIDGVKTNFIEALSEFNSLLGTVETIDLLKKVHRYAVKLAPGKIGSTVTAAIWLAALFDIMTSANLLWKFGLSPTFDAASDVASLATTYERSIRRLLRPATIRGKYVYSIPSEYILGWEDTSVTTRIKMRISIPAECVISSILPLEIAGANPTLSRVWASIPFSFAADWIYDMSSILDLIDNQTLMLGFRVEYTTISHTIQWEFPNSAPFIGLGDELDAGYRHYTRYTILSYPGLTPTRFPSIFSQKAPSWDILGSLVFQLVT